MTTLRGAVMVCGTASDVGKSAVVAGLCRLLARRGVRVAPFKGQNMALNSAVTADGAEIGRAQYMQARAAGVEPEAAMNPVLLKPTSERSSQVVVLGRPWRTLGAADYQRAKPELVPCVLDALADLRSRFDVVVCEGAGSPAEINLYDGDLVNLGLAARAGVPALLVGDIDRGGVFAHLYGTVALLPEERRRLVRGFVVNKFRGDPGLLGDAAQVLEARCGVPTLGVLPWMGRLQLESEDSLAIPPAAAVPGPSALDVAVVRLPRLSNFTDVDPLLVEPGVGVRYVDQPGQLGRPDLVVLPGTKSTVADLDWLRHSGLAAALTGLVDGDPGGGGPVILGICGGYQMLGVGIEDPEGVECDRPHTEGLGLLDVRTRFARIKTTRRRLGRVVDGGPPVAGYEIHHGQPVAGPAVRPWFELAGAGPEGAADAVAGAGPEGAADAVAGVYGTSLHGVLEEDRFRRMLLAAVAARRRREWTPSAVSFAEARQAQIDRLADACEAHLNLPALLAVIARGARGTER